MNVDHRDAQRFRFLYGEPAFAQLQAAAAALPGHLAVTYGIRVTSVTSMDVGVFRVDRQDRPSWVARISPATRRVDQVEGDAKILQQLERDGVAAERCAHPEPVSTLKGLGVLVTRYIAGTETAYTEANLHTLGGVLGRLHALPSGWGGVYRDAGALHQWCPNGGLPGENLAAAESWLRKAEATVAPEHQQLYETLRERLAAADGCGGLPHAFIHPDYWPGNVIATLDGQLVPIDWTSAGRGPRLRSLATLLWLACTRHPQGSHLGVVHAAVAGYRQHVHLDHEEVERLAGAMLNPVIVVACLHFCLGDFALAERIAGRRNLDLADAIAARVRHTLTAG